MFFIFQGSSLNTTYASDCSKVLTKILRKDLRKYNERLAEEGKIKMVIFNENTFLFRDTQWNNFFIQGQLKADGGLHLNLSTKNQKWLNSKFEESPESSEYLNGHEGFRFAIEYFESI